MRKLAGLQPERVFYYFEEISNIPRESGNEKAISDYLVETGKKLGLETFQDEFLNVVLRKKATKGYENSKGVVLQGHMDMVCEKTEDSNHNFLTDPIDLIVEGNIIHANKTTLGGDNGVAVAMALALLEDDTLEHAELEFIATTEEETTMGGALNLKSDVLKGKLLINIDSEEEGIITVGSAGGLGVEIYYEPELENIDINNHKFFRIKLDNLYGGHSGMEIDKGRANANKVLAELLSKFNDKFNIKFFNVDGGTKDNAIPRNCLIDIAIENIFVEEFILEFNKFVDEIKNNYLNEKEITINLEELKQQQEKVFSNASLKNYFYMINELPTGPNTMMEDYPDIVESSDNLAIIKTNNNKIQITISLRSSEPEILKELADKISKIANKYNAVSESGGGYPEWRYRKESFLRDKAIEVYKNLFNEDMKVNVIHAGLECGAISVPYPEMDLVSIGPNMYDVHTPKERMEIASIAKYYEYMKVLLKELK